MNEKLRPILNSEPFLGPDELGTNLPRQRRVAFFKNTQPKIQPGFYELGGDLFSFEGIEVTVMSPGKFKSYGFIIAPSFNYLGGSYFFSGNLHDESKAKFIALYPGAITDKVDSYYHKHGVDFLVEEKDAGCFSKIQEFILSTAVFTDVFMNDVPKASRE